MIYPEHAMMQYNSINFVSRIMSEPSVATPGTVRQTAEAENISLSLFLLRYWSFLHSVSTEILAFIAQGLTSTAPPRVILTAIRCSLALSALQVSNTHMNL